MPIPVTCACGKKLNAPDTLAGKRAKCPTCQKLVLIPEPLELIEDEAELLPKSPQKPPASKTQTRSLPTNRQPTQTATQATAAAGATCTAAGCNTNLKTIYSACWVKYARSTDALIYGVVTDT